jgi:hypothetical protein
LAKVSERSVIIVFFGGLDDHIGYMGFDVLPNL